MVFAAAWENGMVLQHPPLIYMPWMGLLIKTELKSVLKNVILVLQTLIGNSSLVTPIQEIDL